MHISYLMTEESTKNSGIKLKKGEMILNDVDADDTEENTEV